MTTLELTEQEQVALYFALLDDGSMEGPEHEAPLERILATLNKMVTSDMLQADKESGDKLRKLGLTGTSRN